MGKRVHDTVIYGGILMYLIAEISCSYIVIVTTLSYIIVHHLYIYVLYTRP